KELLTLAILEKMNAYYQANARESEDFSCFNKKKNLTKESIENFQIGFAIKHSLFLDQLSPLEIDILTMIGMTKSYPSSNQIHDLFQNRIIFPLHDLNGTIIGFCARSTKLERFPQYLYSNDSFIFDREQILYGYFFAKDHIRKNNQIIITEGIVDVINMHQKGYKETVAILGYAISSNMIRFIADQTTNIIFAINTDLAERKTIST